MLAIITIADVVISLKINSDDLTPFNRKTENYS